MNFVKKSKGMSDEEIAALTKKLARKALLSYIVIPVVAAVLAVILDKKFGD